MIIITIILTTLGIDAADNIDNLSGSIAGSLFTSSKPRCPDNMVFIISDNINGGFCIDKYEASVGEKCIYIDPQNSLESRNNINQPGCKPESISDAVPWRNITQSQATTACRLADKRLPTNKEWYEASLGLLDVGLPKDDNDCYIGQIGIEQPQKTG